jgi:hypothetical protein
MGHVESGTTESYNDDHPVVEDDLDESTIDSISIEVYWMATMLLINPAVVSEITYPSERLGSAE